MTATRLPERAHGLRDLTPPAVAHAGRVPAAPLPRGWRAPPLFCPCGEPVTVAGLCRPCYDRAYHSATKFDGLRFDALVRDEFRCRVCTSRDYPVVHHREPDADDLDRLITLCAACHGVVTHLERPTCWLPALLLELWREQHPDDVLQAQFTFDDWTPSPAQSAPPTGAAGAADAVPPSAPVQGALFACPLDDPTRTSHESLHGPAASRGAHSVP